ncbi:MAG: APC family permease [Peptococcaceae bacterium]|nr:APC family permease [Peptococcaceae bacterium]
MAERSEMKKTLTLTGITVNAMALISPGSLFWLTYQLQAANTDLAGKSTAMDIFWGLIAALILSFLTAFSYSYLATLYPEAGTGSSYYFAERAFMDDPSIFPKFARLTKYVVGWFSHLYYWAYPGVTVAMFATLTAYIAAAFGATLPVPVEILVALVYALLVGYVAYRGINGSTLSNLLITVIQLVALVVISVLAIAYRVINPQHVQFVYQNMLDVVKPHNFSAIMFQATIAIFLLVGFESATALTAEAKSHKDIGKGVIVSLILQGLIFYVLAYFAAGAWMNNSYTVTVGKTVNHGFAAAAASSAPIGDMVTNLGNVFLHGNGFVLMIIVAATVAIALFGTTLACINTGVRITYAMSKDKEMPTVLGALHPRHAIPHTSIWILTGISFVLGAFGVLSITNLSAVTLISNVGTFILYAMTNLVTLVAFLRHPGRNRVKHTVVPVLGVLVNVAMLAAVFYLGIAGGGIGQQASIIAITASVIWTVIGLVYFLGNSKKLNRKIVGNTPVAHNG